MLSLRIVFACTAAALVAATSLGAGPGLDRAYADPTSLDDAKAQLDQLDREASQIGEDYADVRLRLSEGRAKAALLSRDIAAQQARVNGLRKQATAVALAQFQTRGVNTTFQLVTSSDPDSFLSRLSTARKVDENMNSLLQDFQAQQANLADLRRSADGEVAALAAEEAHLGELDQQIKDKVAESEALVKRLTAEQRRRLITGQASRDEIRKSIEDGTINGLALAVVRYAVSKVPSGQYVWGAAGPNSFDCSGLMLAAYRTVGISLPHSSRAQFGVGRAVSRDELQPGDLLFFYSPISHVGMYMGNGLFVHARNPRNDLEITRLDSYPAYQGARRVIG